LERYYLNARPTIDATAATLEQSIDIGGQSKSKALKSAPLALTAVGRDAVDKFRGAALNRMVETMINADDKYPDDPTAQKNYKKRARRLAHQSLLAEEHKLQTAQLSKEAAQERISALAASEFSARVLQGALQRNQDSNEPIFVAGDDQYDDDFEEHRDEEDQPEADIDDNPADDRGVISMRSQGPEFAKDNRADVATAGQSSTPVPYVEVVRQFLEVSHTFVMNQYKEWAAREPEDKICSLCRVDDTVPAIKRFVQYRSMSHLINHQTGTYHSGYKTWTRRMQMQHDAQVDDERWYCPYPHNDDNEYHYAALERLVDHVKRSTADTVGQEHEDAKEADGWFGEDWTVESAPAKTRHQNEKAKALKKIGVKLPGANPPSSAHPEWPGARIAVKDSERGPPRVSACLRYGNKFTPEERAQSVADTDPGLRALIASGLATVGAVPIADEPTPAKFNHLRRGSVPVPDQVKNLYKKASE
jgi:hypothetical protein